MSNGKGGLVIAQHEPLVDRVHHVLRSGAVDIDPVCRLLQRGGENIRASHKVSCLIFHLAKHYDRAVSKEELVQVLWPGVTVAETSLRWLLKEARHCLGDDGESQRYIETVRGFGLRWSNGIAVVACGRAHLVSAVGTPPYGGPRRPENQKATP